MQIKRCCDRFYNLLITPIAEDRIAVDGQPATFCPYCGQAFEITVYEPDDMEYPIESAGPS